MHKFLQCFRYGWLVFSIFLCAATIMTALYHHCWKTNPKSLLQTVKNAKEFAPNSQECQSTCSKQSRMPKYLLQAVKNAKILAPNSQECQRTCSKQSRMPKNLLQNRRTSSKVVNELVLKLPHNVLQNCLERQELATKSPNNSQVPQKVLPKSLRTCSTIIEERIISCACG